MRLPVAPQLQSRNGTANKDARLTNMLKELRKGREYATLRPALKLLATGSGSGSGLVAFNNALISVAGSTLYGGVIPQSSAVTVTAGPYAGNAMRVMDYFGSQYITFNVSGVGQLVTYVGNGTSLTPAAYGLVTGNEAISAASSSTAYVVVTSDTGTGYGSQTEIYRTATSGTPSFSLVKSSNAVSVTQYSFYSNGAFVIFSGALSQAFGRIYYSFTDGATWSSVDISGFQPFGIICTGSRWIIYGSDFAGTAVQAYSSSTLATYSAITINGLSPNYIPLMVEQYAGKFYACCQSNTEIPAMQIFSSLDAVSWSPVVNAQFPASAVDVIYRMKKLAGVLYVAVIDADDMPGAGIFKLTDEETWERVCIVSNFQFFDFATDGLNFSGTGPDLSNFSQWCNVVITPASIPVLGTLPAGQYDFVQSPL